MSLTLPDPPSSMTPQAELFYDELREMLELVRPQDVDAKHATIDFSAGGIEFCLPHRSDPDWTIRAAVTPDKAVVEIGPMQDEFDTDEPGRPWPLVAVDYIAEILRGEIESKTTYRSNVPVRVSYYLTHPDGERQLLEETSALRPVALMRWKPAKTDTSRITFGARG